MLKKYFSLRWVLLGMAIIAILGLTAMNVFSLYKVHQTTIESDLENKKLQVSEFTDQVHFRFFNAFWELRRLDIDHVEKYYTDKRRFPKDFQKMIEEAAKDSIFTDIYFKPPGSQACQEETGNLLRFDGQQNQFIPTTDYPESVCDGLGIARTRMRVLVDEYRFNNKPIFDTHYSMTIALINLSEQEIFGYLNMPINQDYLVNEYLQTELVNRFGNPDTSGVIVWLRDWTRNKTVISNGSTESYDRGKVQDIQRFPDFFDNWSLHVAFTESPTIAASKSSLFKNFVVLGVAVVVLLGAIGFIFMTAQKERALAKRQAGFLANVTHELKTPLAVMQAAGENLADGRVDNQERLRLYGQHIHNEALRLKRMIEKLLDVAKADAGRAIVEPKPADVKALVKKYINNHSSYITNKGFTFETDLPDSVPLVMVDEDSFKTIIGNLVENAIKYSRDEKYLLIELKHDESHVRLAIEDHGIGIPKNATSQVFEKFYRVEDSLTAESKGHGLGLSIVKNLVELNGGQIYVESSEGEGSRFVVEFPISQQQESTTPGNKSSHSPRKQQETPQYVE